MCSVSIRSPIKLLKVSPRILTHQTYRINLTGGTFILLKPTIYPDPNDLVQQPPVAGQHDHVGIRHVLLLPPHVVIMVSTAAGMTTAAGQCHLLPNLLPSIPCHIPHKMGKCWPWLIVCVFTTPTTTLITYAFTEELVVCI